VTTKEILVLQKQTGFHWCHCKNIIAKRKRPKEPEYYLDMDLYGRIVKLKRAA
jgi:hypothetical protein